MFGIKSVTSAYLYFFLELAMNLFEIKQYGNRISLTLQLH
jgi:hypothetical protein